MNDPTKDDLKESATNSLPLATIIIRIGPLGPVVIGGLVENVLNDREILNEAGAALLKEAFHRGVEAILNTLSNAPGAEPPVALSDERGVLDRIELEKDLNFFSKEIIIDE